MHTSTYRGTVKGIHEDYDDKDLVRLEIELPKPPAKKVKGNGNPPALSAPSRSETVSRAMASHLSIGDRIECVTTVSKVRRATRKGKQAGEGD